MLNDVVGSQTQHIRSVNLTGSCRVFSYDEVDSTQNVASEILRQNHKPPFVVIARTQTQGRGRDGRRWRSDGLGNLFATYVVEQDQFPMRADTSGLMAGAVPDCLTPLAISVAIGRWIEGLPVDDNKHNPKPRVLLKWPNDIYIGSGKTGGVLVDSENGIIKIGIGLNIQSSPSELEREVSSLSAFGFRLDRFDALAGIASSLEMVRKKWFENRAWICQEWMNRAWGITEWVSITTAQGTHVGKLQGIDNNGALQVLVSHDERRSDTASAHSSEQTLTFHQGRLRLLHPET